ncbi:hypothetical protein ALC62_03462 [Cyphomyrmex costatus]|uniref:Uncharacterized protein n=1 Tax=Cyphomyrmex costatus TaxID=456900 RepID=A0A195CZV9_9HYME|nr:hypothetical protein ALC62_03462 [Cyphomyrmex costatus]
MAALVRLKRGSVQLRHAALEVKALRVHCLVKKSAICIASLPSQSRGHLYTRSSGEIVREESNTGA